jgi:hypothetical protein
MGDSRQIGCLDDWDKYSRLNAKRRFVQRYAHALALGPFVGVLILFHGPIFQPSDPHGWNYGYSILMASLFWAIFVAVYGVTVITRHLLTRCPRCNGRFGLRNRCRSCGLPRSAPPVEGIITG